MKYMKSEFLFLDFKKIIILKIYIVKYSDKYIKSLVLHNKVIRMYRLKKHPFIIS